MQLFILIPTVKDHQRWDSSDYLGEVIVRAQCAEEARMLAAMEYTRVPRVKRKRHESPWRDAAEVACEPYVGPDYSRQGGAGILYPSRMQ